MLNAARPSFDNRLRGSSVGARSGVLRQASPGTHVALHRPYQAATPRRPQKAATPRRPHQCATRASVPEGLAGYQARALAGFMAVFEHLNDIDTCLSEMYRLLIPGGHVYADFGPLWSSSLGRHVHAQGNGMEFRHWDPRREGTNRMFFEDFEAALRASGFELVALECDVEHVPARVQASLEAAWPGRRRFYVRSATVVLRKGSS